MKEAVTLLLLDSYDGVERMDTKVLAVKRLKSNGKLGLPGGKVDPGETLEEAVIREVKEECNIKDDDVVHCDDTDDKKKIVVGTIDLKESLDSERKLYVSQYSFEQYVYTYKDSLGRWNICINPKFIARHSFCRAFVLSEVVNLFYSLENLIDVLNNEDEYVLTEEQKDFIKNNTW